MKAYQVMVEGVFVVFPELGVRPGGFQTTFFVLAINAANATKKAGELLGERMKVHSVVGIDSGIFTAYYWVHDIWEVTLQAFSPNEGRDSGFTFFLIGRFEMFFLACRGVFLRRYRKWLLVQPR
ncbi:hypothetical protein [Xanthomonas euvesicatoria]|uniref:hypothetical protein n=1 Tax=Xanthomonas euvesicatoria TaxID=456327 RepID=UPI001182242F|nr:hypothetical protein [Xanthomonas euvesicatoria]MBV6803801.1 hypothetical protein [Xanthomonas campestris pv. lawsoniae]MBV6872174.1 hypothetical protein [Xanthomonas campestris pv. veroniae]MBV6886941.1 hypothetical protein [Xanthomonas campestris pv. spermacoces]QTK48079.1 hypothetical protein XeaCFBP3836p_02345 [Xanthomonas euvesicatoria pv. alfalfae]